MSFVERVRLYSMLSWASLCLLESPLTYGQTAQPGAGRSHPSSNPVVLQADTPRPDRVASSLARTAQSLLPTPVSGKPSPQVASSGPATPPSPAITHQEPGERQVAVLPHEPMPHEPMPHEPMPPQPSLPAPLLEHLPAPPTTQPKSSVTLVTETRGKSSIWSEEMASIDAPIDFSRFASFSEVAGEQVANQSNLLIRPWWCEDAYTQSTALRDQGKSWELDALIWLAVRHSPYVNAVLIEPRILEARVDEALGEFDPTAFIDSIFNDTSDPVGNSLVTGTANRFNEHFWENSGGLRSKNTRGGVAQLAQEMNMRDNNSDFLIPRNQAHTRMVLRYTQPLMRGAGQAYNRSTVVLATVAAQQTTHDVSTQIQSHVASIVEAYWELYVARVSIQQIDRGIKKLTDLRDQLAGRTDIDSLRSQLMRAESAIARQQANRALAVAQLQSAETNLRAAVGAPELRNDRQLEVVPTTPPIDWKSTISAERELNSALLYHPNVLAAQSRVKAAKIRMQVAENELRPTLNLVLEGYVSGLNGGFDSIQSFEDQFSRGAPSYSGGVSYARPHRNRTAQSILRQRRLEMQRILFELDQTLLVVGSEVETAIASVEAAYAQLESSVRVTLATHTELEYLLTRWRNAFIDGAQTSLLLDQLLNAEVQIIAAENAWARAQADHMLAIARLRQATGTLVPMLTLPDFAENPTFSIEENPLQLPADSANPKP